MKPPYAIGSVPSLSGHAIAYRWRSLPRVRRHRASKPQGSSERVLRWQITMDQLIFVSLSHTHYWYEVGMLKVPAVWGLVDQIRPVPRQPARLHTQAESGASYGIPPEFRGGVHLFILNRHTPSGQSRVYRVTQLRTDGVHCRESAGTGPVNLKVVPNECCLGRSPWTNQYAPLFPTPTVGMKRAY